VDAPSSDHSRRERPGNNGQATTTPAAEPDRASEPRPVSAIAPSRGADGDITMDMIVELWSKIRADVKAVNRRIEALLQQIDPVSVTGNKVILVSAYEFHRNRMNSDEARMVVEDVISRLVNQRVQVSCVSREEGMAMTASRQASESTSPVTAQPYQGEAEPSTRPESAVSADLPQIGTPPQATEPEEEVPSRSSSAEADAQRIQAAKNIFDAEEFED